jgi:hypothetical protein
MHAACLKPPQRYVTHKLAVCRVLNRPGLRLDQLWRGPSGIRALPCTRPTQQQTTPHSRMLSSSNKLTQALPRCDWADARQAATDSVCPCRGQQPMPHQQACSAPQASTCAATICTMAAYSLAQKTNIFKEVGAKAAVRHALTCTARAAACTAAATIAAVHRLLRMQHITRRQAARPCNSSANCCGSMQTNMHLSMNVQLPAD